MRQILDHHEKRSEKWACEMAQWARATAAGVTHPQDLRGGRRGGPPSCRLSSDLHTLWNVHEHPEK